jgi:ribosome-associated protein YbcJ (S4-like RNA binding protein)
MEEYILFEEYITLGKVIKELGLISTGGQAKIFLAENDGKIFYNDEAENRRGKKLRDGDVLEAPEFDLAVKFIAASAEDIAEHEAEKAEEARVKALVKKMNADNKKVKIVASAKTGKSSDAARRGGKIVKGKGAAPRFPGR